MTQIDESLYIKDCYAPNEDLINALYDGMDAYMKSDTQTGDAKMAAAKDLYPAALANCPRVNAKIGEWGQKFEDLRARPDWDEISKKIYEENKAEIDLYVEIEFRKWT